MHFNGGGTSRYAITSNCNVGYAGSSGCFTCIVTIDSDSNNHRSLKSNGCIICFVTFCNGLPSSSTIK